MTSSNFSISPHAAGVVRAYLDLSDADRRECLSVLIKHTEITLIVGPGTGEVRCFHDGDITGILGEIVRRASDRS